MSLADRRHYTHTQSLLGAVVNNTVSTALSCCTALLNCLITSRLRRPLTDHGPLNKDSRGLCTDSAMYLWNRPHSAMRFPFPWHRPLTRRCGRNWKCLSSWWLQRQNVLGAKFYLPNLAPSRPHCRSKPTRSVFGPTSVVYEHFIHISRNFSSYLDHDHMRRFCPKNFYFSRLTYLLTYRSSPLLSYAGYRQQTRRHTYYIYVYNESPQRNVGKN